MNPGCVLMHQAADQKNKKKKRKTHSCINMSPWKVPNYTGRRSTVPLAVSGNGNLNSARLAIFKIQISTFVQAQSRDSVQRLIMIIDNVFV